MSRLVEGLFESTFDQVPVSDDGPHFVDILGGRCLEVLRKTIAEIGPGKSRKGISGISLVSVRKIAPATLELAATTFIRRLALIVRVFERRLVRYSP